MPALVFVPEGKIASGKLAQTIAYGATVVQIDGDFDQALSLLRLLTAKHDVYLVNSVNPFRLEGQKTIVFEMLEQRGWQLDEASLARDFTGRKACVIPGPDRQDPRLWAIEPVPLVPAVELS